MESRSRFRLRAVRAHASPKGRREQGLSLIETSLLVAIVGVLLAVALPTFVRTVETSKTAEAAATLASLYRSSASYYATARQIAAEPPRAGDANEAPPASVGSVAPETPAPAPHVAFCLAAAAGPTPAQPSPKPVAVDFLAPAAAGAATWRALGFTPTQPLRYRYSYLPTQPGCHVGQPAAGHGFRVRAEGDLDGDGVLSSFERGATAVNAGEVTPDPVLRVRHRME